MAWLRPETGLPSWLQRSESPESGPWYQLWELYGSQTKTLLNPENQLTCLKVSGDGHFDHHQNQVGTKESHKTAGLPQELGT